MIRFMPVVVTTITALVLITPGIASAQAGRWEVIEQRGGYRVARVAFQGLATGIGLTCERGVPVVALSFARAPARNPARVAISVDGAAFEMALMRNGVTNVWVAGVRDRRLIESMAAGSVAQIMVEGASYGTAPLAGSREAFAAALASCYRAPVQTAVAAPAPSATLPIAALTAWENHARDICRSGGDRFVSRRFTPYSESNPGKLDDTFLVADLNGDGQPDLALVTDDQGCSQHDYVMFTNFVVSGSSGYRVFEGFGGKQSVVSTRRCGSRDVMVLGSGAVWGWKNNKVDHLGTDDALRCPSSTQASAQVSAQAQAQVRSGQVRSGQVRSDASPRNGLRPLQVEFILSPRARAHLARGHKLSVYVSYGGLPVRGKGRGLETEEDGSAWLGNSNPVVVSSGTPVTISPTPAIAAKQGQVQQLMVSAHGTQTEVKDWRLPLFVCADDQNRPIDSVRTSLKLRCNLSGEAEMPPLLAAR